MYNLDEFQDKLKFLPFIQRLPSGLQKKASTLFGQVSSGRVYAKGETLYKKGDHDDSTGALLMKGAVEIDRGKGPPITCRAPELFGEMMLLDQDSRRLATITFSEESLVCRFKWNDLTTRASYFLTSEQQLDLKYAIMKYAGARFEELEKLGESDRGNAGAEVEPEPDS